MFPQKKKLGNGTDVVKLQVSSTSAFLWEVLFNVPELDGLKALGTNISNYWTITVTDNPRLMLVYSLEYCDVQGNAAEQNIFSSY
jgi:hypothetical protein